MASSKPILYGNRYSPPVRAVLLVCDAIGLNIEYRHVDFANGEFRSEEYRKKNPQHTVPMLEVDGKYLWESHAIIIYLMDMYAKDSPLYPQDLFERALINQRLFFNVELLYVRLRNISMGIYFDKLTTIPQQKIESVYEAFDFLEIFLATNTYIIGDNLTIADLCCVVNVASCQGFAPVTEERYPKLYNWLKRMESLPYYEESNGKDTQIYIDFLKSTLEKKITDPDYKPF